MFTADFTADEMIEFFLNESINRISRELSLTTSDARYGELLLAREEWSAVKEIFDREGFGGREDGVVDAASAEAVCKERRAWLRDQRAEGLR